MLIKLNDPNEGEILVQTDNIKKTNFFGGQTQIVYIDSSERDYVIESIDEILEKQIRYDMEMAQITHNGFSSQENIDGVFKCLLK